MLSNQHQSLDEIFAYFNTSDASLRYYRVGILNAYVENADYADFTKSEVYGLFRDYLEELEKVTVLNIVSSLEARFHIDYLIRATKKYKDGLSRKFRELYQRKGARVSLEHDILSLWKEDYPQYKHVISEYISVLKYRHWLAHGRYWVPKLGRNFDLMTVTTIANCVSENVPFLA